MTRLSPKRTVQNLLFRSGYAVRRLTDDERRAFIEFQTPDTESFEETFGSDGIAHLEDLRQRYDTVDLPAAVHSVWAHRSSKGNLVSAGLAGIDLVRFRASGSYVWNYHTSVEADLERLRYYLFYEAIKAKDAAGLLQRLPEDGAFGCPTFEFEGIKGMISRDLLDSVGEINFLERNLGVLDRDDLRVLDIGAGYGRMAHRLLEANPQLTGYTCVDAIPESTFLSEFYLKHHGLAGRSRVIPLDQVDQDLTGPFDLALNIHSFSECTYAAATWWLQRVRDIGVKHLMIVPNPNADFTEDHQRFICSEPDGSKKNYLPFLTSLGYEIVARENLVDQPAESLLGVEDVMFLFELRD